ncbi:MAG: sporulation integral membrane protein YtvI [Clostridia bacterium]|nr:sporulation integral membrane protein YtvI [Clostridia bacterium]
MEKGTVKRLSFVINIAYFAIFVALFYCIARYALSYVAPFLIAFAAAYALQRPVNFIHRKSRGKLPRGIVGTVLVLLITAAVVTLIAVLGVQITGKLRDFISFLTSKFSELPRLIDTVKNSLLDFARKLPEGISATLTDSLNKISTDDLMHTVSSKLTTDNILSALKTPLSGAWSMAKQVPVTIIAVLITIISACFLTADYRIIKNFILLQFSEERRNKLVKTKKLILYSLSRIVKSYLLIILITTAELALGLGVLKLAHIYENGYIIAISLLIAIIDIIPVLGTGTVLIPWAVISFITGEIGMGISLLVMYVIITIIRQIIEPKLVAGQFDLPAIVTIASMYIGTKLFGPIGIFLLPITIILLKLLVDEGVIKLFRTSRSVALAEAEKTGKDPDELLKEYEPPREEHTNAGQKIAGFISKKVTEIQTKNEHRAGESSDDGPDAETEPKE